MSWDTTTTDFYDIVDGFAVILHPDQKSVSYPVPDKGLPPFYLPKWVSASFELGADDDEDDTAHLHTRVEGFAVGGLDYYPGKDVLPPKIAGFGSRQRGSSGCFHSDLWYYSGFCRNFCEALQKVQQPHRQHALWRRGSPMGSR